MARIETGYHIVAAFTRLEGSALAEDIDVGNGLVAQGGLLLDVAVQCGNLLGKVGHAGLQACYLVLQVLHLERQLAAQGLDAVHLGEDGLQVIQRFQALLHSEFFFFLFSHRL